MLRSTWLRLPHERNRSGGGAVVDSARRVGRGGLELLGHELGGGKDLVVVPVIIVVLHHCMGLT